MSAEIEYLILSTKWSGKHGDKYATWYAPESNGYRWSIDHAGTYTKEEALSHNDGTVAVPKKMAIALSVLDDFETVPAHYLRFDRMNELIDSLPKLEGE